MSDFLFKVGQRVQRGNDIYIVREAANDAYSLYSPSSKYIIHSAKKKVEKEFKSLDEYEEELQKRYQKELAKSVSEEEDPGWLTTAREITAVRERKEWAKQTPELVSMINNALGTRFNPEGPLYIFQTVEDRPSTFTREYFHNVFQNVSALSTQLDDKISLESLAKLDSDEFTQYKKNPFYVEVVKYLQQHRNVKNIDETQLRKKIERQVAKLLPRMELALRVQDGIKMIDTLLEQDAKARQAQSKGDFRDIGNQIYVGDRETLNAIKEKLLKEWPQNKSEATLDAFKNDLKTLIKTEALNNKIQYILNKETPNKAERIERWVASEVNRRVRDANTVTTPEKKRGPLEKEKEEKKVPIVKEVAPAPELVEVPSKPEEALSEVTPEKPEWKTPAVAETPTPKVEHAERPSSYRIDPRRQQSEVPVKRIKRISPEEVDAWHRIEPVLNEIPDMPLSPTKLLGHAYVDTFLTIAEDELAKGSSPETFVDAAWRALPVYYDEEAANYKINEYTLRLANAKDAKMQKKLETSLFRQKRRLNDINKMRDNLLAIYKNWGPTSMEKQSNLIKKIGNFIITLGEKDITLAVGSLFASLKFSSLKDTISKFLTIETEADVKSAFDLEALEKVAYTKCLLCDNTFKEGSSDYRTLKGEVCNEHNIADISISMMKTASDDADVERRVQEIQRKLHELKASDIEGALKLLGEYLDVVGAPGDVKAQALEEARQILVNFEAARKAMGLSDTPIPPGVKGEVPPKPLMRNHKQAAMTTEVDSNAKGASAQETAAISKEIAQQLTASNVQGSEEDIKKKAAELIKAKYPNFTDDNVQWLVQHAHNDWLAMKPIPHVDGSEGDASKGNANMQGSGVFVMPQGTGMKKEAAEYGSDDVAKGVLIELEHTQKDKSKDATPEEADAARKIAMDHLAENPHYYDRTELKPVGEEQLVTTTSVEEDDFQCTQCEIGHHCGSSKCVCCRKSSKEASLEIVAKIVKRKDGYHVMSEEGKHLGGPYSHEKARERLRQIELFKNMKGAAMNFKEGDVAILNTRVGHLNEGTEVVVTANAEDEVAFTAGDILGITKAANLDVVTIVKEAADAKLEQYQWNNDGMKYKLVAGDRVKIGAAEHDGVELRGKEGIIREKVIVAANGEAEAFYLVEIDGSGVVTLPEEALRKVKSEKKESSLNFGEMKKEAVIKPNFDMVAEFLKSFKIPPTVVTTADIEKWMSDPKQNYQYSKKDMKEIIKYLQSAKVEVRVPAKHEVPEELQAEEVSETPAPTLGKASAKYRSEPAPDGSTTDIEQPDQGPEITLTPLGGQPRKYKKIAASEVASLSDEVCPKCKQEKTALCPACIVANTSSWVEGCDTCGDLGFVCKTCK